MSKFIKYNDSQSGETVYVNVSTVSKARFKPGDNALELIIGDSAGKCKSTYLSGNEAVIAKGILDNLSTG